MRLIVTFSLPYDKADAFRYALKSKKVFVYEPSINKAKPFEFVEYANFDEFETFYKGENKWRKNHIIRIRFNDEIRYLKFIRKIKAVICPDFGPMEFSDYLDYYTNIECY